MRLSGRYTLGFRRTSRHSHSEHLASARTQNSAVEWLRVERDTFRAARDTANAEVEKLQLLIKQPIQ
jgi:hypothetical protein